MGMGPPESNTNDVWQSLVQNPAVVGVPARIVWNVWEVSAPADVGVPANNNGGVSAPADVGVPANINSGVGGPAVVLPLAGTPTSARQ